MKRCVKYRFLRKNIAARSRFEVNFKPSCPYPTKINSVDIPHLDQKIIRQPNLLFFNAFQIQTKTQHNIWLILGDVQSLKIYPKKYRVNFWENHFFLAIKKINKYLLHAKFHRYWFQTVENSSDSKLVSDSGVWRNACKNPPWQRSVTNKFTKFKQFWSLSHRVIF